MFDTVYIATISFIAVVARKVFFLLVTSLDTRATVDLPLLFLGTTSSSQPGQRVRDGVDDAKAIGARRKKRRGSERESGAHVAVSGSESASRGVANTGRRGDAARQGRETRGEGRREARGPTRDHTGRGTRALYRVGQHTSASGVLAPSRPGSCVLGWARWSGRAEATQIAHARTLPGWHSPAGRQAERKVLLSVPPWAVQPVSIVPSAHYVSRSPRLSQHPPHVQVPLSDSLFFLTFLFSQPVGAAFPPSSRLPPSVSTGITGF